MADAVGEVFICSKFGPNLSEMEFNICKYIESNLEPVAGF